jgi:predicted GNAT superfamily acetyltransferase
MTSGAGRRKKDEIKVTVGPFRNFADFKTSEEIQREVWCCEDIDIVPAALLLAADHCGGMTLGAYNSLGEMVGFVSSILGVEDGKTIQHSHMLGVRVAYRNFNVGFKLKLAQRKEALKRKIRLITWTFDPLQPVNAYFNLAKLGAVSSVYKENYYGESSSGLHRGLPTDRFVAMWHLDSNPVKERLNEGPPKRDPRKLLKQYAVVNQLEEVAPGMARSSPVKLNCTDDQLLFEIPYNLPEIKNRNLGISLEWQGRMRQVFRNYFRKNYAVVDFCVGEEDGHLRAFYLLAKKK